MGPPKQGKRDLGRAPGNTTRRLRAGLRRGAQLGGAVVVLVGLLVTAGWWWDVERLISIVPGWPTMMTNTALLCVLAGGALWLQAPANPPRWRRVASTILAGAVTLVAGLSLIEHVSNADFGVDRLFVPAVRGQAGGLFGRPSPQTATTLLLAGAALLTLDRKRGESYAWILALVAGSIPTVALLGYAFGVPELYSVSVLRPHTGMAVHTAAALVVLTAGILAARPEVGPVSVLTSEHAGGFIARRLVLGLLLFLPAAFLVILGRRLNLYPEPVVSALLVFFALVEGLTFISLTAVRLNADDLARKGVEGRLRESERRFRELFEQASDGIFIADLDGRYIDVNGAGCRMLGHTRKEILGKTIADLIPGEDVVRLASAKAGLLGGGSQVAEWRLRRADGSWLPVEVSAAILEDGRWQAFCRDITERKRNEAELDRAREADRRLRGEIEDVTQAALTVSEAVADLREPSITTVLHTFALQAQILTGARYVAIGLGTDPDKPFDPWVHLGMSDETVKAIGHPPRPVGTLGRVAREGQLVRTRDLRRDPAFRGLPPHHPELRSFLGVPIRFRGRSVGNLYLAEKVGAAEFSDQDQRMVEMLASRAAVAIETVKLYAGEAAQQIWLRSIIDQMPEGVMLLNESGGVEAMNRALLALSCEDTGAVDPWGNPAIFDVRLPDGRPLPFDEFLVVRALTRGEVATDQEHLVRLRDGRFVPVLVSAAPVRDPDGRITGAVAVIRDITAMRELERLREEWASIVAHDLRQPVGAISLTAESLSRMHEGALPERERKAVERIRSASGRLNRMIEDLLDASRIEAKNLSLDRRALELVPLVEAVVESHRGMIAGHAIRVAAEPEQVVFIDPDRIHQVLGNLISNAAKYGRPGTEIRIESVARDDVIEVVVTNRGPGIRAEELPRLFSRFGRTREARADRTPGLGLGLYICRGLVEAHGGRIWAESVPGESTSFHFTLPRVRDRPDLLAGAGAQPSA